MSEIYGMRRANGDWFALEAHGRFGVPLFQSTRDATMSRLHNFEMLLFEPVALNLRLLGDIAPPEGAGKVDFFMVADPFASLKLTTPIDRAELLSEMNRPNERPSAAANQNHLSAPGPGKSTQSEWWN